MSHPFLTTFASVYATLRAAGAKFPFLHFETLISIVKSAETMFLRHSQNLDMCRVKTQNFLKFSQTGYMPSWIYAEASL